MRKINNKPNGLCSNMMLFLLSILFTTNTFAATFNSTGVLNGDYHTTGTWNLPGAPGPGDIAIISNGHTVYATNPINIDVLNVQNGGNLTLQTGGGMITAHG